ncbi:MAG: hypothetical protein ACOCPQ_04065 [Desulfosudaceae bacterium]
MWGQITTTLLIGLFLFPPAVIVGSFIRTAGGTRYNHNFPEADKCHQPGAIVQRHFKSTFHMVTSFFDTLLYAYPLLLVYALRHLSPAFREKIMITTAMANRCAQ